MSRIVGGERLLGDREKEVLRGMLWQVAEFCGVRILTYAVMSNHFHVLVFVPPVGELSEAELVRRYRVLYERSRAPWQPTPDQLGDILQAGDELADAWRERLLNRMGEVSAFMKTVKQRFSVWYNKTHGRYGTLWADRFKSVLVEGEPRALATVAAYIDLNPVRAGLADDPAEYRWCGYAEAMAGSRASRLGLAGVFETREGPWKIVGPAYRRLIFGKGLFGSGKQGTLDRSRVMTMIENGGTVSLAEALRCRVRYFTDGAVLGSSEFVQSWAEQFRGDSQRKPKPRLMQNAEWGGLSVYRGLRKTVFG